MPAKQIKDLPDQVMIKITSAVLVITHSETGTMRAAALAMRSVSFEITNAILRSERLLISHEIIEQGPPRRRAIRVNETHTFEEQGALKTEQRIPETEGTKNLATKMTGVNRDENNHRSRRA